MTLYFFNAPGFSEPDQEGSELPDLPTARREAIRLAADLLYAEAESVNTLTLTVTNTEGARLMSINCDVIDLNPE